MLSALERKSGIACEEKDREGKREEKREGGKKGKAKGKQNR